MIFLLPPGIKGLRTLQTMTISVQKIGCIELESSALHIHPSRHLFFTIISGNTRTICEICSRSTIKTPERRHKHYSGIFLSKFEQVHADWFEFKNSPQKLSCNFLFGFLCSKYNNNS